MDNANSKEYLDKILTQVLENMKRTAHAPSVQMTDIPRDSLGMNDDEEAALDDLDEDENSDKRHTQRRSDKYVQKNGELSDSEDEEMDIDGDGRPSASRKRRIAQNYRHIMDVGGNDSGVETGSGLGTPQHASSVPDDAADEMNVDDEPERPGQPTPSPQNGEQVNGSAAVSGPQSPAHVQAVASHDEDVEMGDADPTTNGDDAVAGDDASNALEGETITVQQQHTPPESPPTPADAETTPSVAVAAAPGNPQPDASNDMTDSEPTTVPAPDIPPATSEPDGTGATASEASIKQEAIGDDPVAQAAEEGRLEREMANAEGEAKTEAVSKVEAAEGDADATVVPVEGASDATAATITMTNGES
jgi:histone deacetylase 1/2